MSTAFQFTLPYGAVFTEGGPNLSPAIFTFKKHVSDRHTEWDVTYTKDGKPASTFLWTVRGQIYVCEEQQI